jgi:hypothetical protein
MDLPEEIPRKFCQDLTADEALVTAVTQKAPLGTVFGDKVTTPAWKNEALLVSRLKRRSHDRSREREADGDPDGREEDLAASHASLASKPIEVCALIDEAATAAGD